MSKSEEEIDQIKECAHTQKKIKEVFNLDYTMEHIKHEPMIYDPSTDYKYSDLELGDGEISGYI